MERSTITDHLNRLLEIGVVEKSRTISDTKLYQIDRDNEVAKGLAKCDDAPVMGPSA